MLRQIINPAIKTIAKRPVTVAPMQKLFMSSYGGSDSHRGTTMDDLPVPSGSWEAQYKSRQTKYNMHLAMGILVFGVSVLIAKSSGLLYFNYHAPAMPKMD